MSTNSLGGLLEQVYQYWYDDPESLRMKYDYALEQVWRRGGECAVALFVWRRATLVYGGSLLCSFCREWPGSALSRGVTSTAQVQRRTQRARNVRQCGKLSTMPLGATTKICDAYEHSVRMLNRTSIILGSFRAAHTKLSCSSLLKSGESSSSSSLLRGSIGGGRGSFGGPCAMAASAAAAAAAAAALALARCLGSTRR